MVNILRAVLLSFYAGLAGVSMQEAVAADIGRQAGPNSVQALDYAILPGQRIIIRLIFKNELKHPPSVLAGHHPTGYIALDFADTENALGRDPVEVKQRDLRSLQFIQTGSRTRLVIILVRPLVHEIELKGRELWMTQRRAAAAAARDAGRWLPEAASGGPTHGLREVGFQHGESGQGSIIVELSRAGTPIEVRRQGKTLVVDFLESALPPHLERRLDVQDFGTPIRAIETYRQGGHVRMKIELKEADGYTAYQADRRLVVSLR